MHCKKHEVITVMRRRVGKKEKIWQLRETDDLRFGDKSDAKEWGQGRTKGREVGW